MQLRCNSNVRFTFYSRKKTVLACDGLLSAAMFIFNGYCAILIWILSISLILISKTEAANINPKMLDSREHISINHSVNITRSHDGDIIIVKGKKSILLIESFLWFFLRFSFIIHKSHGNPCMNNLI